MTKKLTPWESPGTGETIMITPISFYAITEAIRREPDFAEPKPPLVEVEINGKVTAERNWADPDYDTAKQAWRKILNEEGTRRLIRRLAFHQKLTAEQKAQVQAYREALGESGLEADDVALWLLEFALTDQGLKQLVQDVSALSDPQEDRVKKT